MFIKKVRVEGFKSYRQLVIGDEDAMVENFNLIVGQNGHGKSNFLHAIMFVLSDMYSHLPKEEKRRVLHESNNERSNTMKIEIEFDNRCRRFALDLDKIIIRREFNGENNKDEYYINGRHTTKEDLHNLLESAGFSQKNPYYFVQQGEVNSLVHKNESELFLFLSEVAGTRAYEQKRENAMTLLSQCEGSKNKLGMLVSKIDGYMGKLKEDVGKARSYAKIRGEQNAIHAALHKNKIRTIIDRLGGIQEYTSKYHRDFGKEKKKEQRVKTSILEVVACQREEEGKIAMNASIIERFKAERDTLVNNKDHNLHYNDTLQVEYRQNKLELEKLTKELKELEKQKRNTISEIESLKPKATKNTQKLNNLREKLTTLENSRESLIKKENFNLKFKSKTERNKYLETEKKKLDEELEEIKAYIYKSNEEIADGKNKIEYNMNLISEEKQKQIEWRSGARSAQEAMSELKTKHMSIMNELKKAELTENENLTALTAAENQLKITEAQLSKTLGGYMYSSIKRLTQMIKQRKIYGFHGLLISFLEVKEDFWPCLNITAKNTLFSLIVDNIKTGMKILDLNKQLGGSVINIYNMETIGKMTPKRRSYPETQDSVKVLDGIKLKTDLDLSPLLEHLFSKTIMVKNYSVALKYAEKYKLRCVSTECEVVNSGAYISKVGLYNPTEDRFTQYTKVTNISQTMASICQENELLGSKRKQLGDKAISFLRDIQDSSNISKSLQSKITEGSKKIEILTREYLGIEHNQELLENVVNNLSNRENNIENNINSITKNKKEELKGISKEEEISLGSISREIGERESDIREQLMKKGEVECKISKLEGYLINYVGSRERGLGGRIEELKLKLESREDWHAKVDVEEVTAQLSKIELGLSNKLLLLNAGREKVKDLGVKMKALEVVLSGIRDGLEDKLGNIQHLEEKVLHLLEEKEDISLRLKELKITATDTITSDSLLDFPEGELLEKIQEKSRKLDKFKNIHEGVLHTYNRYDTKSQEIKERIIEYEREATEFEKYIEMMDNQKNNAFKMTFQTISYKFAQIFPKIIPHGKAKLTLLKADPFFDNGESKSQFFFEISSEKYIGIKIEIQLPGMTDWVSSINISGGQKVAVAISLIFAIQHCDKAPLYIFDEIDSALDPQYRANLANLVKKYSRKSQFIMTSFKPELIAVADRIHWVKSANNRTKMGIITEDQAHKIINPLSAEGEDHAEA